MTTVGRRPLSRERVVTVAIELVDANGIDQLSMRKLGAALGVEAMSLYNHVANKDDLLDAILEEVLSEIELPAADAPWDERLRRLAREFRQAGRRHPGVLPLFGSRAIRSVRGFAPLECAYTILRDAGLGPDDALDAFVSAAAYTFGFVQIELGGFREVAEGRTLDFASLDPDEHRQLIEIGTALGGRDSDREFEFGLDVLVAGVEQRLGSASPR